MSLDRRGSPIARTEDVMLVQEAMRHLALYDGPVDGIAGASTRRAVRAYKRRHGLTVDATLGEDFIEHVRDTV